MAIKMAVGAGVVARCRPLVGPDKLYLAFLFPDWALARATCAAGVPGDGDMEMAASSHRPFPGDGDHWRPAPGGPGDLKLE